MMRVLLLQLARTVGTTWGILTLLFLLTRLLPQEQDLTARFAAAATGFAPSSRQIEAAHAQARHRLGLDIPLFYVSRASLAAAPPRLALRWQWNGRHNQYHRWLQQLARADLGQSYRTGEPVGFLLAAAFGSTLRLTLPAALLLLLFSLLLGLWLAPRERPAVLGALMTLDSLPLFVVALLLLLLLANPDVLALFPAYGFGEEVAQGWHLRYLALPLASLVLAGITEPALQLATALRTESRQQYVLAARAKGLSAQQARYRHALRNALLPSITLLTDLLPNLLAGSVVVELIFALPGMGRLLAEAAAARDYPVLLGGTMVVVVVRQLSLWLADACYLWADPRLRTPSA